MFLMLGEAVLDTLSIALKTLPVILVTLVLVEVLATTGVLSKLRFLIRPLVSIAKLPAVSGVSLLIALGSTLSADTIIGKHFRENRLSATEALLSSQANLLPPHILETFTYVLPVVVPLLGFRPGLLYVLCFLGSASIKVILIIAIGRFISRRKHKQKTITHLSHSDDLEKAHAQFGIAVFRQSFKKSWPQFSKIAWLLLLATFIVSLLKSTGLLIEMRSLVLPIISYFRLPESVLVSIVAYIASPTAGTAALGALYDVGEITGQTTIIAVMVGSILSLPLFALRFSLPRNVAVFGPKLGSINVALSLGFNILVRLGFIACVPILWAVLFPEIES